MIRGPRRFVMAMSVLLLLLVLSVAAGCGEEASPLAPTETGTIETLQFTADTGSATCISVLPTKPGLRGHRDAHHLRLPGRDRGHDAAAALDYLVSTGIKDILEYQGSFGLVFTPIDCRPATPRPTSGS